MIMLKRPALWVVMVAVMLFGAACSSAATVPADQSAPAEVEPAQEEVVESLPEAAEESSEVVEEPVEEAVEEPAQPAADVEVLHRANPAPPESFVADSPEWVAATGRPQLIEFFAYW
jgi:hypothetical protein